MSSTIAVVGGGLASARFVRSYRESGGDDRIRLLSADTSPPYHRPPLSKRYLRGEAELEDTYVEPEAFYREQGVELELSSVVARLHAGERQLELAGGERVQFDRLVIASGASPRRLGVPGEDLDGVFSLRRLADSTAIRERARGVRRAVIVGAGFVGLEVAASLRSLGLDVALVHRGAELFAALAAPPLSSYLTELYRERGVELVLRDEVAEFRGGSSLAATVTRSGRELPAELAVVGVGVSPSVGFVGSELELDDGIVVNERFETSAPRIYAVGDVARFYDPVFDRRRRIEHWSNASYQGSELGRILAGVGGGYNTVSTFFSELFGVTFKVFGDLSSHDELVLRGAFADGSAIGFFLERGRLVATVLTGQDDETEAQLKELIRARVPADPARLVDPDVTIAAAFAS